MARLPYAHMKAVIFGRMVSDQSWSVGLTITAGAAYGPTVLATYAQALSVLAHAWWNGGGGSIGQLLSTDTTLVGVRVYYVPPASTSLFAGEFEYSTPIAGANTARLPLTSACVVSLISDDVGRKNRGRIYIPAAGAGLSSSQMDSSTTSAVATATAALITGINTTNVGATPPETVVVGSNQATPPPITSVRVDSLVDVQRRRQDKVGALFTHAASV